MAIILQMRERMEEMQRQIQEFVQYIQQEVLTRANAAADPSKGAIVPVRRSIVPAAAVPKQGEAPLEHGIVRRMRPLSGTLTSLSSSTSRHPRIIEFLGSVVDADCGNASLQAHLQRRILPANRETCFPAREVPPRSDRLIATGVAEASDFLEPQPATDQDILLVHKPEYVAQTENRHLERARGDGNGDSLLPGSGRCLLVGSWRIHPRRSAGIKGPGLYQHRWRISPRLP